MFSPQDFISDSLKSRVVYQVITFSGYQVEVHMQILGQSYCVLVQRYATLTLIAATVQPERNARARSGARSSCAARTRKRQKEVKEARKGF